MTSQMTLNNLPLTLKDLPQLSYPVKSHPTWAILDSSKIQEFMTCPRRFFYRYVLGWTSDRPNNHLVFGEAWHLAMEHLLTTGYSVSNCEAAYEKFLSCYREVFTEQEDMIYDPKTPDNAWDALLSYVMRYNSDSFEVLHTEVAGTVPINDSGDALSFKIDAILRSPNRGIYGMDHKTGSRLDRTWQEKWALSFQMGTYSHALFCLEKQENVWGYEINGAFFYKSKDPDFVRVPIRKPVEMMQVWLDTAQAYTEKVKTEFSSLSQAKVEDQTLKAFPMNTEACSSYGGCPFLPYCTSWANPLQRCESPPLGMKEEWWNPHENEEKAKKVVHL